MMRLRRRAPAWTVVLLLAGVTASTPAQDKAPGRPNAAPPDERSARVEEALRQSGLKAGLTAIRTRLVGYLDTDQTDDETRRWIAGSLKTVYAPATYLRVIKQALLEHYDADALTGVLAWYRSPVGRKITRLEEAAQAPGQRAARNRYLAGLEERQPSGYRLVVIFSIDEASRSSAATAGALKASMDGWTLGIEQLAGERETQQIRQIEAALGKYRAESRDSVADDVLRESMHTYRDATDADLRAYAEFLESDAGKWLIGTAFKAHQAFLDTAAAQIAEDLVKTATGNQTRRPPQQSTKPLERDARTPPTTMPSLPARK
jgi:hypothetical protein